MHDQLTELGAALAAFATDLGPRMDGVTLVTLTEFGRRVAENGSGGLGVVASSPPRLMLAGATGERASDPVFAVAVVSVSGVVATMGAWWCGGGGSIWTTGGRRWAPGSWTPR